MLRVPQPQLPPELQRLAANLKDGGSTLRTPGASPAPVWAGRVEARAAAAPPRLRVPVASPAPPRAAPSAGAGAWRKYADDEGDPYYYNVATQETTWERPLDFVGTPDDRERKGSNCRVLVVSSAVVKLQSQFILGAAREDVTVILFDDCATSPSALVAMIQAAVPRGSRVSMLGFMTQPYADACISLDGTAMVELVRGQSEQTSRRSLRSDRTLKQFWQDVGALVQDGGCIDLLKSSIGRAQDSAWLLADLEQLTHCTVTAEESLVESSGEKYFDMANLSLLIRGSTAASSSRVAGPGSTPLARGSAYPTAQRGTPSNLLQRDRVLPGSGERALPLSLPPSDSSAHRQHHEFAGAENAASPARSAWRRYFDDDGDVYFANVETGETTWVAPAQFMDQPNQFVDESNGPHMAERTVHDSPSQEHSHRDAEQRTMRQEMSDQAAAGREAVALALSQVEQLLAQAKAEEAAGQLFAQEQREAEEQERGLEQAAAAAAAAMLAEQGDGLGNGVLSPSILAAKAAHLLSEEREQRAKDLQREQAARSVLELQVSQTLAREKMEKAAVELRASEEAKAKAEALAELANMRKHMEDLERHIAEEAKGKRAAQEQAAAAKKEAADREAIAAVRTTEAQEAQEEAAALAARVSRMVEESLHQTLSWSGSAQAEEQSFQSFDHIRNGLWPEVANRAEHWQSTVVNAEEQARLHANRSIAEQATELMRKTEREKLHAIEEVEHKTEALQEQVETAAKREQQRRLAAEALAQEWRTKAEEADRALEAAAKAEAAATAELQQQREKPNGDLTTAAAVQEAIDRARKAEVAEQGAKEAARAAQAKFVEHLKESDRTTAAAVQEAIDRSRKAESAEQLAKKHALAAQAKLHEHQHTVTQEQRRRQDLEEQVKFEVEASQAAEAARTAMQHQLTEAREMLSKQQSSAAGQEQAESIEVEVARAKAERNQFAEVAEAATREATELDLSRALDHQARVVAEEGLAEEQKRRQEAEARATEVELALAKAEELLRAHEETAYFYMTKAQDEAAKATATFAPEELLRAAEQAAKRVAATAVRGVDTHNNAAGSEENSGGSGIRTPVDDAMYQNVLAGSDAKIAAALKSRESAESSAKSATDQALSQAQHATQLVETLTDDLAKTRAEQERHQNQAAELASARAQAEEQNARMLAELARAQRQLEEAMSGNGGSGGIAASTARHAVSAGAVPLAVDVAPEEDELLAALRSDPEARERMLRQKTEQLKNERQLIVQEFYEQQQWHQDVDQMANSPWHGGPKTDLRVHYAPAATLAQGTGAPLSGGPGGALRSSLRAAVGSVTGGGWQQNYGADPPPGLTAPAGSRTVRALFPWNAEATGASPGDLYFAAGDMIEVLNDGPGEGWLTGRLATNPLGATGMFPENYVEIITEAETAAPPPPDDDDDPPPPPPPDDVDDPPPPPPPEQQQQQQQQQLGMPPAQTASVPGGHVDSTSQVALLTWVNDYCSALPGVLPCRGLATSFNDGVAFCAVLAAAGLLDWSAVVLPGKTTRSSFRQQVREQHCWNLLCAALAVVAAAAS